MGEKKRTLTKWLYWFLFAVAIIFVYKTLDNFSAIGAWFKGLLDVLMPFIIGILIAYILYIPSRKVENFYRRLKRPRIVSRKARPFAVFTVYLIVFIIVVIAFRFLIPAVANAVVDFAANFQGYYSTVMKAIEELPDDSVFKNEAVLNIVNEVKNIDFRQFLNMEKIAEYAKGAINVASKIFDFFVALVVSVYILVQRKDT